MKRIAFNALVDICSLIAFVPMLVTGLVLYLYLPSGTGRGGVSWMGIARHDWVLYHDIAGFAFAILVIVHLLLHASFFRTLISGGKSPADEKPDRA